MVKKLALMVALAAPALAWSQTSADRMERKSGMDEKSDQKSGQKAAFEGKHNYDVDGKVSKVEGDKLTIRRDDLPEATLGVSSTTKVELDGDRASLSQLTPGQDVKASFNLEGDKPLAVEVKAKRTDVQKDVKKQRDDERKDAQKR